MQKHSADADDNSQVSLVRSRTRVARERGAIDTPKEPREQGMGKVFSGADVVFSFPQPLATLPLAYSFSCGFRSLAFETISDLLAGKVLSIPYPAKVGEMPLKKSTYAKYVISQIVLANKQTGYAGLK